MSDVYNLLGAYVPKCLAIALFNFSKNSLSLNMFSTREDSTVKKKIVCRKLFLERMMAEVHYLKKKVCRGKFLMLPPPPPPSRKKNSSSLTSYDNITSYISL